MSNGFDESKVNRDRDTGQFDFKDKIGTTAAPMSSRQRLFATTYATADNALDAAMETQEFADTYVLSHDADGYHVADDEGFYSEDMDAFVALDHDGTVESAEFDGNQPQDSRLLEGQAPGWQATVKELGPVQDFRNGTADRVRIYNVMPFTERRNEDREFETDDEANLFYVCADNPDRPDKPEPKEYSDKEVDRALDAINYGPHRMSYEDEQRITAIHATMNDRQVEAVVAANAMDGGTYTPLQEANLMMQADRIPYTPYVDGYEDMNNDQRVGCTMLENRMAPKDLQAVYDGPNARYVNVEAYGRDLQENGDASTCGTGFINENRGMPDVDAYSAEQVDQWIAEHR